MASEANDTEVHELLLDLKSALVFRRREAAKKLGALPFSSERIIEELVEARDNDWDSETRAIAAKALTSPIHLAFVAQNRELMAAVGQNAQAQLHPLEQPTPATSASPSLSWIEAWRLAVLKPSVSSYERILRDPAASTSRARKWLFVSSFLWIFITFLFATTRSPVYAVRPDAMQIIFSATGLTLLVLSLIVALLVVVGFIIFVGVTNFIVKLFGGTGGFAKLYYLTVAYTCPLYIVGLITFLLPPAYRAIISVPTALYTTALGILAVKVVYGLGWIRTVVAGLIAQALLYGANQLLAQANALMQAARISP